MSNKNLQRRKLIKAGALGMAAFTIVPRHVLGKGHVAPSDKLRIAGIGAGGKGESAHRGQLSGGWPELHDVEKILEVGARNDGIGARRSLWKFLAAQTSMYGFCWCNKNENDRLKKQRPSTSAI